MDLIKLRKIAEQERLNAAGTIGTEASRALDDACDVIERLRAALKPFVEVEVEGMLSLEEANLDKEDFYRARTAYSHEQKAS